MPPNKCGICGREGHNASSCPMKRCCSLCGKPGHDARNCPNRR